MLSHILSAIDIFGIPAILKFSGKEKSTSRFGGGCTLLFSLFALWAIYNGAKDLFSTENPQTITSELYSEDPREFIISPSTFPIMLYLEGPLSLDYIPLTDPTMFNVIMTYNTINAYDSEKYEVTPLERCAPRHFGNLYSAFYSSRIENSYCLAQEKLPIQGVFGSPIYTSITIAVYQCDNAVTNNGCASQDEIDKHFNGGWGYINYGNMVIDPSNYESPDRRYKDEDFVTMNTVTSQSVTIELRHLTMFTDSGWLTENWSEEGFAKVNQVTHSSVTRDKTDVSVPLYTATFVLGKLETSYSRSYKKIQTVLAEVSGLLGTGLWIFVIATSGFLNLKVRERLMNELFDINLNENTLKEKKKNNGTKSKKKKSKVNPNTIEELETSQLPMMVRTRRSDTERGEGQSRQYSPLMTKSGHVSPVFGETQVMMKSKFLDDISKTKSREKSMGKNMTRRASLGLIENQNTIEEKEMIPLNRIIPFSHRNSRDKEMNESDTKDKDKSNSDIEEHRRLRPERREIHLIDEKEESVKLKLPTLGDVVTHNKIFENSELILESPTKLKKYDQTERGQKDQENTSKIEINEMKQDLGEREETQKNNEALNVAYPLRKSEEIKVSFWEYLLSFIYKPKKLKRKLKILNEAGNHLDLGLDVIYMIKKMREVDKFKALLLNKDQLILFNNLPKPEIRLEENSVSLKEGSLAKNLIRKPNLAKQFGTEQEALNSYEILRNKENKTELEEKLVEIFYESLSRNE